MSRRGPLFICTFIVGLVGACIDLSEDLDGEPCTVPEDCWHKQECARTLNEIALGLPGVCKPEGTGCVIGAQLGCGCIPMDATNGCFVPAVKQQSVPITPYPQMVCDVATNTCQVAPPPEMP